jgi:diadenosine tetraphosphate (Ap4A) HIT family hydrolase
MNCHSCNSNSGVKRISPGAPIYKGRYWIVEHAYPSGILGWNVIVLLRHCEKLHELSMTEWIELAEIQNAVTKSMHKIGGLEKEYSACFAELEGFKHIHFHIIPKPEDLPSEFLGTKSFQYLKVGVEGSIDSDTVANYCLDMAAEVRKHIEKR